MKRVLDHDPATGVTEWFDYDPVADEVTIWSETKDKDIKSFLDLAQRQRNDEDLTRQGIKKGFWKYATLPAHVILELRGKGIDVFNPGQTKDLVREINANYPATKTTAKWHR